MALDTILRLNQTGQNPDPAREAERLQASLEMATHADTAGFGTINLEEHHCTDAGWMGSPLVMAGLVAARTRHIRIRVCALLVTLYDPIRLAEEIALLDQASDGRIFYVAGQGYRPLEYHALDKDWDTRGARADHVLDTLQKAWTGEPFDYRGQTVRVRPVPLTRPHPLLYYGGMSAAAAQRAARFGLPFFPPAPMPGLASIYAKECERLGTTGHVADPGPDSTLLFIDESPEQAWADLGHHFLREASEYGSWAREGVDRPYATATLTVEELRAQKRYEILTPEECRERISRQGKEYRPILHPLCGGVPIDRAWRCIRLYTDKVLGPLGLTR
ncbi:MAG: LLM class flavin-dependent oxidoreductase [Proteobacteria bacterium]|nr:LLM class flavin-dependent oxidoreductase [Pseudomonadota bacterium]HQR02728.1 LLM class flavin-dependent oxidoreductase [Rhodocyclaceae bacterium]